MKVYFFDIREQGEVDKTNLPQSVLSHCKKRESFLAAKALIDMGAKNLHYNEKKKPLADNCYVSISHCENIVAVCTSDKPVGIDIEKINTQRDLDKIANRFYHGKELEYFKENHTADVFFEIWTKKEAYSKIGGEGVGEIYKGFDVLSLENYTFETRKINDYILSVCEMK